MGAMAAAEQAIELVLDGVLTSKPYRASQTLSRQPLTPANDVRQHMDFEQQGTVPIEQSTVELAVTPATLQSSTQQQNSTTIQHSDTQLEGLKVRRRSLHQLQHQQLDSAGPQQDDGSSEMQPLIARPEGLLRVSLQQRPAKQHFDR